MIALSLEPAMGSGMPKNEPDGGIPTSSLPIPEEVLDHALELSARLETRNADIAAWGEFLAPQPQNLAGQAERILAQARSARDAAVEALRAFLAQHGIEPQELKGRRPVWLASRRETDSMVPPASAADSPDAARSTRSLEVMRENWLFIAGHVPGLIAPRVLKRAQDLVDALLAAEARNRPQEGRRVQRQHATMSRWARWKREWAGAARDAAERNLYDYLEHSGMNDRMRLARDYLREAWKRTLAEDIQLDKAPPSVDTAGALALRARAYLDVWAEKHARKADWPLRQRPALSAA